MNGLAIDLLLLHAPDRRVPLATSARALARAKADGLVRRVGLSNVTRKQLEEVAGEMPIAAVELAIGAYDDVAVRGGVLAFCAERGIEILAHSALGGPSRAPKLARDHTLDSIAALHAGATAVDVFVAYLLALEPRIVPLIGARRPATIACLALAEKLKLADDELARIDQRFSALGAMRRPPIDVPSRDVEVVLMMGIPGAGKSRAALALEDSGYERLNRDTVGGTLKGIARKLDERLTAGATRVVLDNTYVSRAVRSDVVRIARAHGAHVRCVFFDTAAADAQVNAVHRMLDRFGHVPPPEKLLELARSDAAAIAPHAITRMTRELERPSCDEGFADVEVVPFVRDHRGGERSATFVAWGVLEAGSLEASLGRALDRGERDAAVLVFAWRPGAAADVLRSTSESLGAIARALGRTLEVRFCTHPAGPPICWCRPPLPALLLEFARAHAIDLARSVLVGRTESASDQGLARSLGITFLDG